MIALGIKYYEPLKEKIASILRQPNSEKAMRNPKRNDIVFEDGKEIGVLINKKFTNNRNNNGINLHVPSGKMWTPLYYELESTSGNCSYTSIPKLYAKRETTTGWERSSSYYFFKKEDFVSYSVAQRNDKAVSGDFAIMCEDRYCESESFLLYFLEE